MYTHESYSYYVILYYIISDIQEVGVEGRQQGKTTVRSHNFDTPSHY